jgi:hypothetical protein
MVTIMPEFNGCDIMLTSCKIPWKHHKKKYHGNMFMHHILQHEKGIKLPFNPSSGI